MLRKGTSWIDLILAAMLVVMVLSLSVRAQTETLEFAPPPMRILPKDEKERLDKSKDAGSRTKLALNLMEGRLVEAEAHNGRQNFDHMFRELGHFQALMDDSLEYLNRNNTGKGKFLDNFKRFEIGLRKFLPRIEAVRRELPLRYEDYVRTLMIRIRDARTKATEPFFDDTVIRRSNIDQ
jgi:hypothetical protein